MAKMCIQLQLYPTKDGKVYKIQIKTDHSDLQIP